MFATFVEIFRTLYDMSVTFAEAGLYLDLDLSSVVYSSIAFTLIFELVFFLLKGTGLYMLSKRQNLSMAWLSFVPFVSYVQMGRLVGEVKMFGNRTKHLGLFVTISLIINQISSWIYDIVAWYDPFKKMLEANAYDPDLYQHTFDNIPVFANIMDIIALFSYIAYVVFWVFLIISFFRYYERKHSTLYAVLSIFFDLTPIFIFVVRKHDKFNYFAEQRKYYENLYKQQYQGQNNASANGGPNATDSQPQQDDPFIEYSKKPTDDVFTEYSQSSEQRPPVNDNANANGYSQNNVNTNGYSQPNDDNQDEDLF